MNPKFSIGDVVAVRGVYNTTLDTDQTVVTSVRLFGPGDLSCIDGVRPPIAWGFWYQLSHIVEKTFWVMEASLRRIPPPKAVSFDEMMTNLIGKEVIKSD